MTLHYCQEHQTSWSQLTFLFSDSLSKVEGQGRRVEQVPERAEAWFSYQNKLIRAQSQASLRPYSKGGSGVKSKVVVFIIRN